MHLGKADDEVGIEEGEKVLHQLGALPELFLGLIRRLLHLCQSFIQRS